MTSPTNDDADLQRLSSLIDRLTAAELDGILSEAVSAARSRASPLVRRVLLEELLERMAADVGAPPTVESPPGGAAEGGSSVAQEAQTPTGPTLYMYAVLDGEQDGPLVLPDGIDPSQRVELVRHDDLAAAVSWVDPEFLEAATADSAHLADLAGRHDDIVSRLGTGGPALPFRLGTVCRSVEDVHRLLATEHDRFRAAMDSVRGCDEFGVQVVAEPAPTQDPPAGAPDAEDSGSRYLQARADERRAIEAWRQRAAEAAEQAHERLEGVASRWRTIPGRRGRTNVVSNRSYLVPRARAESFRAEVDSLDRTFAASGVRVRLTGPWPPYSFAYPGSEGSDGDDSNV